MLAAPVKTEEPALMERMGIHVNAPLGTKDKTAVKVQKYTSMG